MTVMDVFLGAELPGKPVWAPTRWATVSARPVTRFNLPFSQSGTHLLCEMSPEPQVWVRCVQVGPWTHPLVTILLTFEIPALFKRIWDSVNTRL